MDSDHKGYPSKYAVNLLLWYLYGECSESSV